VKWLLVSATEGEAAALPRGHPAVLDVLIIGVGKVAAAASVAHRLAGEDPAVVGVLNIGTAGSLVDGLSGIIRPSATWAWDFAVEPLRALGIDALDTIPLAGGDSAHVVASGDAFVADPARRAVLAERATLVDMECYGVAWAASQRGVRVEAVKWISDQADADAHTDWPSMLRHGADELGRYVTWLLSSRD
jgi:nucleoside phosphorylase